MSKRLIFYFLVFLIGFVVFLPVPFAPNGVHKFLSRFGSIFPFVSLFVLVLFSVLFLIFQIKRESVTKFVVIELIGVSLLFIVLRLFMHEPLTQFRYWATVSLNRGKPVEEFVNPFLGLFMMDCRGVSRIMDVVFMPEHLGPDTDYLEYAPQKDLVYGSGSIRKFYGGDWYQETAASQWYGSDLGECAVTNGLIRY